MIQIESDLADTTDGLRARLGEAEDMLRAIRHGEVDALVVEGSTGNQVYTLHSAEEPYRNLVEQMQEGAVVITGHGDIVYANARFAELVGEPLESVVGTPITRFINPSDGDDFALLLAGGAGRCRCSLLGSTSGPFEVSLSLTTMVESNGRRLNLIVTDLTELLAANRHRDRAERDNRTKGEFLAMLGHELRTPLSAIINAARVIELAGSAGERATRAHEVIAHQIGHVKQLINDLLDVERVVSGKIRLQREPLDMAEAVRRAVATVTGDPELVRRIEVNTEPAWVDADPIRLQQILTNVVANAVKYTPPGARIEIALRANGNDVSLTVTDAGFGISPRLLPFIFDMYMQADRTLDRAQGGLGIGLTLVRRLVELHGGTITAASEGEGRGSTFTVSLAQISSAREAPARGAARGRRARPKRVLVIEDSDDAREMLRMMLELAGHVVYDAADGVRGLQLLDAVRPDAAIIDLGLPGIDGYQVASRIREEPYGRSMCLLALTGNDGAADVARSSAHGFNYHLVKPVDPDHLARLLARME